MLASACFPHVWHCAIPSGYEGCVNGVLQLASNLQKIPTLTVVAAALVDGDRRVLLQQRAPGRAMAGLWEFPGGKVGTGERSEAALVRGLEEELGIVVEPASISSAALASAGTRGRRDITLFCH